MPRSRTEVQRAAGKLTSAIQKVWGEELGEAGAKVSEEALHISHTILQACSAGSLNQALAGRTISEFIGQTWVHRHRGVQAAIRVLEAAIVEEQRAHA